MTPLSLLETCVYVADLKSAKGFYGHILGLELVQEEAGRHLFFRCGQGMLLVFNPKATAKAAKDGLEVPPHGCSGPGHVAFATPPDEMARWKDFLGEHGIEIEREIDWPNGARSLYFRDPAGNSLELATPRLWEANEEMDAAG